ncbi:MAG: hypothetical protein OXF74_07255 [Rhodobacteraceae bacterium]|nr:hypothetical protein [Paracoccaceae bacterium]
MSAVLARQTGYEHDGPVWMANHYRAIADIAIRALRKPDLPYFVPNETISQWLDTRDEVTTLVRDWLVPLRGQKSGDDLERFNTWLATIRYI